MKKKPPQKVRIVDKERPYYYWVTVQNPDRAKAIAIKKHCASMGIAPHDGLDVSVIEEVTEVPLSNDVDNALVP